LKSKRHGGVGEGLHHEGADRHQRGNAGDGDQNSDDRILDAGPAPGFRRETREEAR